MINDKNASVKFIGQAPAPTATAIIIDIIIIEYIKLFSIYKTYLSATPNYNTVILMNSMVSQS